jgi:hypothetical protein
MTSGNSFTAYVVPMTELHRTRIIAASEEWKSEMIEKFGLIEHRMETIDSILSTCTTSTGRDVVTKQQTLSSSERAPKRLAAMKR